MHAIGDFLHRHVGESQPGSLYISGAPGTGKTAVIKHILDQKYQVRAECSPTVILITVVILILLLGL